MSDIFKNLTFSILTLVILSFCNCKRDIDQNNCIKGIVRSVYINYYEDTLNQKGQYPPKVYFFIDLFNTSSNTQFLKFKRLYSDTNPFSTLIMNYESKNIELYAHYSPNEILLLQEDSLRIRIEFDHNDIVKMYDSVRYGSYKSFMTSLVNRGKIKYKFDERDLTSIDLDKTKGASFCKELILDDSDYIIEYRDPKDDISPQW